MITITITVTVTITITKMGMLTIMMIYLTARMIYKMNWIIFCVIHAMTFLTILLALQIKNQAFPVYNISALFSLKKPTLEKSFLQNRG